MNQSKPALERWKKASYPFPERRSERERHIYTYMMDKGSRWEQGRGPEAGEEFQGGSVKAKKKTRGGDMSKTQRERHGRTRELIRTTLLFRPCFLDLASIQTRPVIGAGVVGGPDTPRYAKGDEDLRVRSEPKHYTSSASSWVVVPSRVRIFLVHR
ncbi:unnamed protein product [Musa acuminata subsp. burmannicoides]